MDKPALVAECARLHTALSKSYAQIHNLEEKLQEKTSRVKNLAQKVLDTDKSKQKLQSIVDNLNEVEHISEETAERLKVN